MLTFKLSSIRMWGRGIWVTGLGVSETAGLLLLHDVTIIFQVDREWPHKEKIL